MELQTINIKGKDYVTVDTRLAEFRRQHASWSIETNIELATETSVTMKAFIKDETGRTIGTGIAHEERDDKTQMCNKTSFFEVCETSAIGRAIAIATNIGNIGSIASADEVVNAVKKQEDTAKTIDIDYARTKTTSKGKYYYELDDSQLQWIIDSEKSSAESKQCAKLILDDRKANLEPVEFVEIKDGDLPF